MLRVTVVRFILLACVVYSTRAAADSRLDTTVQCLEVANTMVRITYTPKKLAPFRAKSHWYSANTRQYIRRTVFEKIPCLAVS